MSDLTTRKANTARRQGASCEKKKKTDVFPSVRYQKGERKTPSRKEQEVHRFTTLPLKGAMRQRSWPAR